ncbi:hypothetical protein ACHAXT_010429 [Thalassiosira profunda]
MRSGSLGAVGEDAKQYRLLSQPSAISSATASTASLVLILLVFVSLVAQCDASGDASTDKLFAWARSQGAKITDAIEIRTTSYGGRGIFAKRRIAANTELIRIPYHLQLGVRQLAEGADAEMQRMARSLPWEYVLQNELSFVPLSIALLAEKRKGGASIFGPFLQSLPAYCSNAMGMMTGDDLNGLKIWAPHIADKVVRRRAGIESIHGKAAPVSIEELRWAASIVCSRSLVRKRIKELDSDQVDRIGAFAASDHSRMLPVIDLVNHGSLERANVWVGHLSRDGGDEQSEETNDYSTSLKSTRDIDAGEELLFDYGGGRGELISNDRLLLDYGFVLPGHIDRVSISVEDLLAAVSEMEGYRAGMAEVSGENTSRLSELVRLLIKQAAEVQESAPLLFTSQREPTVATLAIAIGLSSRDGADVSRVLNAASGDASQMASRIIESSNELQREFARFVLKRAAGLAVKARLSVQDGSGPDGSCEVDEGSFGRVAPSDHSRMLPVIDLVNHGSLERANVWVGHLSRDGGDEQSEETNDYSTSLKSTRDIDAGEELLFDYGGGRGELISNDRLLLDYGFVLPGHIDRVSISVEDLLAAVSEMEGYRAGMAEVSGENTSRLSELVRLLIKQAAEVQEGAPLLFYEPTRAYRCNAGNCNWVVISRWGRCVACIECGKWRCKPNGKSDN